MFKNFALRFALVLSGIFGLINCSGGGGDPKPPTPPPPPVTYTATVNGTQGITVSPPSASGVNGETKVFSITLPTGYTNPVANPANAGTFSNGVAVGTYNFTVVISGNATITISATPPVPLYSISGKVTGTSSAILTLSTGKSVVTDVNGFYVFTGVETGNYVININLPADPAFRNVGVNNADSVGNDFTVISSNPDGKMVISVLDHDGNGNPNNLVRGLSWDITAGTTWTAYVQKPGESNFTLLGQATATQSGVDLSMQLHGGVGFYNTDGTPWPSGIATYKVDRITTTGEKTSVIAKVGILMGTTLFGPLQQAVPSSDGKTIKLVGSFPTLPVVILETAHNGYSVIVPVLQGSDYVITVPAGAAYSGSLALTVESGGENSTLVVVLPPN